MVDSSFCDHGREKKMLKKNCQSKYYVINQFLLKIAQIFTLEYSFNAYFYLQSKHQS